MDSKYWAHNIHVLIYIFCKILHPFDSLKQHWKCYHARDQLDDSAINVLRKAGAQSQEIGLPEKKVPVIPLLEAAEDGWWCSQCQKAAPSDSTVYKCAEHEGCPGHWHNLLLIGPEDKSQAFILGGF